MDKTVIFRLPVGHYKKLEALIKMTGWNQSEVLRRLIEAAVVPNAQPSLQVNFVNDFIDHPEPKVIARGGYALDDDGQPVKPTPKARNDQRQELVGAD